MTVLQEPDPDLLPATAGEIAVINLESTRQRAWDRFLAGPERSGTAEYVLEQESLVLAFLGDFDALDRLVLIAEHLTHLDGAAIRTVLIRVQVASATHRFAEARSDLARSRKMGAPPIAVDRLSLAIDQACGHALSEVLAARQDIAAKTRHLEDLVPLGALLADLGRWDDADRVFQDALHGYRDVSPFALAWVCFQLGVLWGEQAPESQPARAVRWYPTALAYLPSYVKARVHLAEIYLACGRWRDAEDLLMPVMTSGDPEVLWRMGDVSAAMGRIEDAATQIEAARTGFEQRLDRHVLAFADHGAAFYSGSGRDPNRSHELAAINLANRPTLRAFEQAHATAINAGKMPAASEILAAAISRWGRSIAFQHSSLAAYARGAVL